MTNLPSMNHPATSTVEFRGAQLITIKQNDIEYVAMRPVVEAMGIAWPPQQEKLRKGGAKFSCNDIVTTGKDGKNYNMLCIPITKFNGWAFSINTERIPDPEVRKRVELYQEECFLALYNYWHKGIAERKPETPETITPAQQHDLSVAVKEKANGNGKAIAEIWSRLHRRFRIAKYDQLPSEKFDDAITYVTEMELRIMTGSGEEKLKLRIEALEKRLAGLESGDSNGLPQVPDNLRPAIREIAEINQNALNNIYGCLCRHRLL